MIAKDVTSLLRSYSSWLVDESLIRPVGEWVEISLPFLDRHNDYLQIFVREEGEEFLLSDDGFTIADLESSGCSLDTENRQELLDVTLRGFGIQLGDRQELETRATRSTYAERQHYLIQAMLAVNDFYVLAQATVRRLFEEDVDTWLREELNVIPMREIQLEGKTGKSHFDFYIERTRSTPPRFIQTMDNPSREQAQRLVFAWIDTDASRSDDAEAFAMVNDDARRVPSSVPSILGGYGIQPLYWSERSTAAAILKNGHEMEQSTFRSGS